MDVPVAIAGAGPVGLALATGLARHGVASLILEVRSGAPNQSRAPGILPRTLEIARSWGVLDELLAAGTRLDRFAPVVVGEPEPRVTLDFGELEDVCATPFALVLPQDRTEVILADHLARVGLGWVRRGVEVVGFDPDEDGVTVRLAGGEKLRAGFLVGCDGARSAVRRALGWELRGRTYPVRLALADVRISDDRDGLPWPRLAPRERGALAALRLGPGLWRLIFTVEGEEVGALEPLVAEVLGDGPFEPVWASTFRIHRRASPRFHEGRVAIAGDAAHLVSPAGGMGMNSGVEDANDLAWTLAAAIRGGDPEALLKGWEAERRAAVMGPLAHTTDLLTRGFLLAPAAVRHIAVRAAHLALETPSVRRRILLRLAMLDVRYDGPRIGGAGGARAPNVLWRGQRVHDLAAREPVVFRFGDAPDVGGLEGDEALARAWGARPGDFAVLRPDGYLGYLGPDPAWVARVALPARELEPA